VRVEGDGYVSEKYGPVTTLDASSILLGDRLSTFLVNRSLTEPLEVQVNLADRRLAALESAEIVAGTDRKAENTYENPNRVVAQTFGEACLKDGVAFVRLPPLSTVAATFRLE
jgi:alpha-N-arabinofuranosidase